MAVIGVRGPWVSKYQCINGVVSYSEGRKLARMTEHSSSLEAADGNDFYSDDVITETDRTFTTGKLSDSVDHFSQEGSRFILGDNEEEIEIDGATYKMNVSDDKTNAPYLGHGIIITKQKNNKPLYRAVIYRKIMFSIPEGAAVTKGEKISWQAEKIDATIMRDDSPTHRWKEEITVDDYEVAVKFIEQRLGIQGIGKLTVVSAAGSVVGATEITVTPALQSGNSYKYQIAADIGLPGLDEVITEGYTDWDGTAEISAVSGQKILVVEVDSTNKAKKAGTVVIVSNE